MVRRRGVAARALPECSRLALREREEAEIARHSRGHNAVNAPHIKAMHVNASLLACLSAARQRVALAVAVAVALN